MRQRMQHPRLSIRVRRVECPDGRVGDVGAGSMSPDWLRALTLVERQVFLRDRPPAAGTMFDLVSDSGSHEAIDRWRAEYPFDSDSIFAERLAAASMSESEFHALLTLPVEAFAGHGVERLPWLDSLSNAFVLGDFPTEGSRLDGFLRVVEPLVDWSRSRLREGLRAIPGHDGRPFDGRTVEGLLIRGLTLRFRWMLGRTLVLELNVARLRGVLDGATPEARYESFADRLGQRDTALGILQEYPVLGRQLATCADQWVAYSLEFLTHLSTDFAALCQSFAGGADVGSLAGISLDVGDRHRNGRAVLIAKFATGLALVYKPRSLSIDRHFNALLQWAGDRGFSPPHRTMGVLDRGTYGWMEFVDARACESLEHAQRFYRRQGAYLALLHALRATDFHHENLIAAGDHPVLVDLEALFSPSLGALEPDSPQHIGANVLLNSVLRTGLLPQGSTAAPDFSGLGSVEGRLSPVGVPQWERSRTDEMHYLRTPLVMHGRANRPALAGQPVNVLDHVDSLVDGFRDMYRLLMTHRDELLAKDGLLVAFADDEIRVVLRPTRTYSHLLEEGFHPDVLRDAVDRDYLFDQLWVPVAFHPFLSKVVAVEQQALQRGDIPIFTTRPDSCDLWTCSGERIHGFLQESGLTAARQRLSQFNERDLQHQLWLIRASLSTQAEGVRIGGSPPNPIGPVERADRDACIRAAEAAGDRLEELAIHAGDAVAWLGLTTSGKHQWSVRPIGTDLYDGLSGIALFLAHLGWLTGQQRFTDLGRRAIATLLALAALQESARGIGGFTGLGGTIYALTQLGMLWDDARLIGQAEETVQTLAGLIDEDDQLDIIGGAAGCILPLIGLHQVTGSTAALDAAVRCGTLLAARATRQERGVAWRTPRFGRRPLVGFSHGVAGIAFALTRLAVTSGQDRFGGVALEAMEYERSLFSPGERNWPDLRETQDATKGDNSDREPFLVAWCHGATGIGLSRLHMLDHFDDSAIRSEIDAAVHTTFDWGVGDNQSLCHGALGNLDFLLQAGRLLGDRDIAVSASGMTRAVLDDIASHGWKCGLPLSAESPGLMTGLAGIGYGLLRIADPSRIPSVLLLDPPAKARTNAT